MDTRVLLLAGVFLALSTGSFGVQIWLPLIIKHEQQHFSNLTIGLISAIPFLFATVAMVIWSAVGSRRGSAAGNVIITSVLASIGFAGALIPGSFLVSMAGITIALVGMNASRGFFWAIPSQFLTGVAAAGGIAFINMIGVAGGFIGPWLMGSLKDLTGSFEVGLAGLGGSLLIAALLVVLLKPRLQNE
jgi:MFS family permease